jgi:hypothetical protein
VDGYVVHGKVYEYFGPLPAILRLPIAGATRALDGRLGQLSMLCGYAVALGFAIRLACRLRPLVRGSAPVTRGEQALFATFTFLVGTGTVPMFLAS